MSYILVTGGAGFIGSHSIDYLLTLGHHIIVLDNLETGTLQNLPLQHPHLQFVEGSILDEKLLPTLIKKVDAVLHLAAIASVHQSIVDPVRTAEINTQGFLHLLHTLCIINPTIRLVYASSASVYGNAKQLPCDDEILIERKPLSPYALQKSHMEDYADFFFQLYGIKSIGLRYFNVYGTRQDPHSSYSGVISRFLDAYQNGKSLTILGDGNQSRDFIHVTDVAKANAQALEKKYVGVVNIATGVPQTLLQLVKCIEVASGYDAKLSFDPPRPGDIMASFGTTKLAEKVLDFKAAVSLQEGIMWQVRENSRN